MCRRKCLENVHFDKMEVLYRIILANNEIKTQTEESSHSSSKIWSQEVIHCMNNKNHIDSFDVSLQSCRFCYLYDE